MPTRRLSRMFQIERELQGGPATVGKVNGRHYDSGAAIGLRYDSSSYGTPAARPSHSEAYSYIAPKGYRNGLSNYTVESFEEERPDEAEPIIPAPAQQQEPAYKKRSTRHAQDQLSEGQPAIISKESEVSAEPHTPSAQPENDTEEKSQAATFEEDLRAILSQQKASPQEKKEEAKKAPPHKSHAPSHHAIFDQIGKNFSQANSFDLGAIAMEKQFDEFDQVLDQQTKPLPKNPKTMAAPAEKIETFGGPVALSDLDIAEDFAIMTESEQSPEVKQGTKAAFKLAVLAEEEGRLEEAKPVDVKMKTETGAGELEDHSTTKPSVHDRPNYADRGVAK